VNKLDDALLDFLGAFTMIMQRQGKKMAITNPVCCLARTLHILLFLQTSDDQKSQNQQYVVRILACRILIQ
jgi:hypothetical protein